MAWLLTFALRILDDHVNNNIMLVLLPMICTEVGRLVTNCNPLLISNYMTKIYKLGFVKELQGVCEFNERLSSN